ncbi:MAG: hypothetical protein AB202_00295 [Parcubacteria bacterium C7867-007]|nr:MAG: hypothetical protein AB202_00295 [Parcubacteria bacterium C7867-007]
MGFLEFVIGAVCLVWWLCTQWYIPKDKLHRCLNLNGFILQLLPGELREGYVIRQYARRGEVEIREYKNDLDKHVSAVVNRLENGGYTEKGSGVHP